jgi:poly[(R)-3-hydroxyalkanoate] polymerase subunit PhaC
MPSPCWISACPPRSPQISGQRLLAFAGRRSRRKGIITSREMGSAFTWMRPDDLVFNYWVNNYLMGEKPPAFDILAWNADGTGLPGALHGQFLEIFRDSLLTRPGGLTVLGTPLHLERISVPAFVTGAVTDHLTPWKGSTRPRSYSAARPPSCSAIPGISPAW